MKTLETVLSYNLETNFHLIDFTNYMCGCYLGMEKFDLNQMIFYYKLCGDAIVLDCVTYAYNNNKDEIIILLLNLVKYDVILNIIKNEMLLVDEFSKNGKKMIKKLNKIKKRFDLLYNS
jgi:hypothetical protein